jgi:adenylate cyclase
VSDQDEATVSLPVRLVEKADLQPGLLEALASQKETEQLGPWLLPHSGGYRNFDARGYQRLLPFEAPGSFNTISLRALAAGRVNAMESLSGDIVLIGSTAPSLRDLFEIPQSRFVRTERQLRMPGVEVHALRVAALLNGLGEPWMLKTLPPWSDRGLELLAILVGICLGESFRKLRQSITVTAVLTATLVSSGLALLWTQGLWIGLTLPVISLPVMAGVGWLRRGALHQRQKQQIERLLGQTTSPAVAAQLWDQRDGLLRDGQFEGKQVEATVLFTDTQDFTSISEQLSPADLLTWLNRGMGLLVQEITSHAIDAALAIAHRLELLNHELSAEQAPPMRVRIGIHAGPVIAGSMGSSTRLEYTVMGDTVNCASRLENLARVPSDKVCRTLLSRKTLEQCTHDDLIWRSVGRLQVKGRQQDVDVLELTGIQRDAAFKTGNAPEGAPARSSDPKPQG